MGPRVKRINDKNFMYAIFCPACQKVHKYDKWFKFNGDYIDPTFTPALVAKGNDGKKCHSLVTDGKIQFLEDSEHSMFNRTVPLPETKNWKE